MLLCDEPAVQAGSVCDALGSMADAVRAAEGTPTSDDIGWQEAVARLAYERTLAETCVGLLKKRGDAGAIDRGAPPMLMLSRRPAR